MPCMRQRDRADGATHSFYTAHSRSTGKLVEGSAIWLMGFSAAAAGKPLQVTGRVIIAGNIAVFAGAVALADVAS